MPDFKKRSENPELIDFPVQDTEELRKNFNEIAFINRNLGGHDVTLAGLKMLIADRNKVYRITDIGCGVGDGLRMIRNWAMTSDLQVELKGIDSNEEVVAYAREKSQGLNIVYQQIDYREYFEAEPEDTDIFIASLFCHHLSDNEIIHFLHEIFSKAKTGFVINDLHRNFFAYFSIKWLTALFSASRLTRNDAPLSVLRGFSERELRRYCREAGIEDYSLMWRWAFRYLIVGRKNVAL